ncbi:aldo/keto reductase [Kaistia geumhonensis]|uniref:Aryl-alcohol dehydrogenase-like predicted oxidoreductase n=1 Tax=Kaistia geumhonensis TaxID=410839 RepID=A0ABU0M8K8_9HYPH|nr:aldo/keto reductase [Kaistia geumhonensis]MCX5477491.1 aldo/keto reductase [Kaistia geumhonensis]MDQ0517302.1 aryl-alcohol dehydrogenase-like predicted oxidoreductase [Kaistia geumhonensis]
METRRLGSSDLFVSVLGLGCNNFGGRIDAAESRRVIDAALDHGVTFLDTADIYADTRSETIIGEVLEGRYDKVVLATKFGKPIAGSAEPRRGSRGYILKAADASLKRLRTERIDLYQMHEPDPETPIEETIGALEELVAAGKIRFYGASNFTAEGLRAAKAAAKAAGATGFVSSQDEYSLVARGIEAELLPEIEAEGLSLIPYFPLAAGLLTGKYRREDRPEGTRFAAWTGLGDRYLTQRNRELAAAIEDFASVNGRSLLDIAFLWLLARPSVASVIAGATRPEQIAANAAAASAASLTRAELETIEDLAEVA